MASSHGKKETISGVKNDFFKLNNKESHIFPTNISDGYRILQKKIDCWGLTPEQ